jgi:hypothetical protein
MDGYYSNVKVYVVDGLTIRNDLEIDFTMGGNWGRYSFIPEGQIWIDECLVPDDKLATIMHELTEVSWMAEGIDYGKAHSLANISEKLIRQWIITNNIKVMDGNIKTLFNKYVEENSK